MRVDGPSATTNRNATITTGSASTASTIRLAMVSVQPLMYPMARPSAVPSTVPRSVASGAMMRMLRAPTMTRESTSRPSWSVPNQCPETGRWLTASRSCPSGSCGANTFPRSAHSTQKPAIVAPIRNVFDFTSWRSNSPRTCPVPADIAPGSTTGVAALTPAPRGGCAGFSIEEAMSARSVATMYTIPIVSTPASSIGKSLSLAASKISLPMP